MPWIMLEDVRNVPSLAALCPGNLCGIRILAKKREMEVFDASARYVCNFEDVWKNMLEKV